MSSDNHDIAQEPISAVLGQLAEDTKEFARAEIAYLKAEAGERIDFALPGLIMICCASFLGLGTLVALLLGLMMILSPIIGMPIAVVLVCAASAALCWILWKQGRNRLKFVFRKLDR